MEKDIFPEIKIVDIKALKERAGAFLSGVWNAGRHVELCLSEHNRDVAEPSNQPELPLGYIDRSRV
jgi:hypothetical protein